MSKGAYLEYECYDARGRSQGRAVVKIRGWADPEKGLLEADHLAASDGYYQYYGESELSKGAVGRGCNVHLHRGDRRELVHLERWRMINPLLMKEVEYLRKIAEVCMREHVVNFAPRVPEPVLPPRGGDIDASGIDKAVAEAAADDADYEGRERRTEEGRLQVVPQASRRGSVGALLEERARRQTEGTRRKEAERKGRRKARSRSVSERRKRSRGRSRTWKRRRDSRSPESSRSSGFCEPSSGGRASCGG